MIELALHNELAEPYVESLGHATRVHLGLNHTSEDLANIQDLNEAQQLKARYLFSNDNAKRAFDSNEDFVIITEVF